MYIEQVFVSIHQHDSESSVCLKRGLEVGRQKQGKEGFKPGFGVAGEFLLVVGCSSTIINGIRLSLSPV